MLAQHRLQLGKQGLRALCRGRQRRADALASQRQVLRAQRFGQSVGEHQQPVTRAQISRLRLMNLTGHHAQGQSVGCQVLLRGHPVPQQQGRVVTGIDVVQAPRVRIQDGREDRRKHVVACMDRGDIVVAEGDRVRQHLPGILPGLGLLQADAQQTAYQGHVQRCAHTLVADIGHREGQAPVAQHHGIEEVAPHMPRRHAACGKGDEMSQTLHPAGQQVAVDLQVVHDQHMCRSSVGSEVRGHGTTAVGCVCSSLRK